MSSTMVSPHDEQTGELPRTDVFVQPVPVTRNVHALPLPERARQLTSDIAAVTAGITLLIVGLWVRDGGLRAVSHGGTPMWTSLAQITGLAASGVGLAGLYLVARPRALEQRYGIDRLFIWHRILGETMAVLVGVHIALSLVAWQADLGWWSATQELTHRTAYMGMATVGSLLIVIVTLSSLRSVRNRMAYESWYFLHLTAYVGFTLAFFHEITLGQDLNTGLPLWLWIALHVAVGAGLLWGRFGRLAAAALRPLHVVAVDRVNDDTVALRLGGPNLAHVRADAGQFFVLRPLSPRLWWQAHPYSLSNAPRTDGLRFTIKSRGDASAATTLLTPGTRVIAEGPYGAHTPAEIGPGKVLFIAGGIGIAPVRSLLERLAPDSMPVVLIRARHEAELVHLDEIRALATRCKGSVHVLVGPTAKLAVRDPFAAEQLLRIVPDLRSRQAVLCGPERLLHAARSGLRAAKVPNANIHYERPWW